jgi:mannose-6-phosphate isomerase-like protein (cupin superfamily)
MPIASMTTTGASAHAPGPVRPPVNLNDNAISQLKIWSTEPHAKFNDQELTIMRLEGQFYWHVHNDSDEMFLIIDGEVFVETREGSGDIEEESDAPTTNRWLRKGDIFVVPQGTAHRSAAPTGASVMFGLKKDALLFMKDDEKEPGDKGSEAGSQSDW